MNIKNLMFYISALLCFFTVSFGGQDNKTQECERLLESSLSSTGLELSREIEFMCSYLVAFYSSSDDGEKSESDLNDLDLEEFISKFKECVMVNFEARIRSKDEDMKNFQKYHNNGVFSEEYFDNKESLAENYYKGVFSFIRTSLSEDAALVNPLHKMLNN